MSATTGPGRVLGPNPVPLLPSVSALNQSSSQTTLPPSAL